MLHHNVFIAMSPARSGLGRLGRACGCPLHLPWVPCQALPLSRWDRGTASTSPRVVGGGLQTLGTSRTYNNPQDVC